ncbi:MAG: right-handed parallel beta-helix repeat-containing protein, partial [Bacteroidales bacterium]|nr:right-handed parallel beta-helix repeat-containing protein [Bacteroidales bacterium]
RKTTGAYDLSIGTDVTLATTGEYQVIMTTGDDGTYEHPTANATATIKSDVTSIFGFEAKNNNNVYDVYYTALSNAYAKAQDNETITLLRNVELAEIFTIDKAITLDGGNKTLTSAAGRAINIDFAGEVNIQNLTIAGSTGCERGINIINEAGTTNLSNVKVSNVSHYAVHVATSAGAAKVNIENSNLSAWGALAIYGKGSEVNVENTTMLGTNTYTGESNDFSTVQYGAENVTININGGSITAKSSDEYRNQAILSESGNEQYTTSSAGTKVTLNTELKFEGSNTSYLDIELDETIIIKVKADYADELQEEGWATVALTGEDEGLVQVIPAVAKIGETYYATLAKAIAAATAGQTIEFIANITEDVTVNKSVTIDGADFEYTGTMTLNNINVTIQKVAFVKGQVYKHKSTGSNAQVTIKDCSFDGQGLNAYAVNLGGGKNINIENVTAKDYGYGLLQVPSSFSNVSLKNVSISEVYYGIRIDYAGAVSLENVTMTDVAKYGIYDSNYGNKTYTIKNSTISSIEIWERDGKTYVATFDFEGENTVGTLENSQYAKYVLTDTDATLTAPEGSNVVTNIDGYKVVYENGMYKVVAMVYVAEITGGAKYESLQAAIDAAVTGDEVVILKDLAYSWENTFKVENKYDVLANVSGKDITLNMNGKKISVDHQSTTDRIYAVVYVENGAGLTVTGNGTIDVDVNNTTPKVAYMFWKRGTTGHLTIENGNYHMDNSEDSMVYSNGDDIVIVKGGTFVLDNAGTGPNHGFPWIFNATGNNQNSIYVIGGTYNYDIRTQYWDAEVNVPSEYTVVDNGNGTWTVVPAQRQTLETGWNWFSSYIADFNGTKGLDMLKSCIGNNGEQIKNQLNSIKWDNDPNYNNGEYFWFGSLEEVSVTEMYMIKTTAPVELVLGGDIVNPAATPITLNDKWTWIGYPVAAAMNVETAFAGINPQDGDIIKTHNGVAQYYANIPTENGTWSGWYGQSLQSMTPGMGYMYYNTSSEAKPLVYPAANANSRAEVRANVTAENNHWAPKASAFANNMNIIAVLESNDMMGEFEVAAFVNGEVRGSARPTYVEPIDAYVLFMTIYGEEGEEVSFKYYDIYSDEEHSINNTVNYSDNAIIGSIREPYMFFANTLGMDEKVANTLSIYPNPTTTNTAISFETTFDMVEVFNSLGAKVAEYRNVDRIEGMEAA